MANAGLAPGADADAREKASASAGAFSCRSQGRLSQGRL